MADYEPKKGWYSPWTQRIANGLPSWNAIRRVRDSNGQQLLNASAGRPIDFIYEQMERSLRNKFINTVDLNEPDCITKIEIPQGVTLTEPTEIRNRLLNSSFEIWTNQTIIPSYWRNSGTGTVQVTDTGFVGTRSLTLSADLNESITVYQEFEENIPAGQEWSFSTWYAIDSALGLTAPATGFGLEAVGYCVDGTTETLRVAFATDTGGLPNRVSVVSSYAKAVYKVRVQVVCSHTGTFLFTDSVIVDLIQAEIGDTVTPWRPHPFDYWPHVTIDHSLAPVLVESGHRAQYVERIEDFWLKAIPTRLSPKVGLTESATSDTAPTPDADGITTYGRTGRWLDVDMDGQEWPYEAVAYSLLGVHKIRFVGTIAPDIYGDFSLAFRNYRNYFEIDSAIVIEAITDFNGLLWVVLKTDDLAGATKRYIAVVEPHTPWPRPAYLEVLSLIELPEPSTSVLITRVEFRYDDQQHIYVGNGNLTFVYRLYYDYFTINGPYLYLREKPESITVVDAKTTKKEYTKDLSVSDFDRSTRRV